MMLSFRTQRALQALILAGLGLFMLHKIWTGTLYWYINQRFLLLILGAAIGLLVLARIVLPGRAAPELDHADADHHHEHGDEHDHDHAHGGSGATWGLIFLAVPLALGLLIPARPLGSSAIANRGINTTAPLAAGGAAPAQLDLASTDRNVLDWVRAFNYAQDPHTFAGQAADVIGFVYHDAGLEPDTFLVSRFAVTCCSADAAAIGLLVRWPGAAALENNTWVRVRGPMQVGAYASRPTPLIAAESLEGVDPPAQPYLYP
jgi:putative membrane protein